MRHLRKSGHRLLRSGQDLPDVVQAGVDLGFDHVQPVHRLLGLDQGLFAFPGGLAELVQEQGEEDDGDDGRHGQNDPRTWFRVSVIVPIP